MTSYVPASNSLTITICQFQQHKLPQGVGLPINPLTAGVAYIRGFIFY